MAERYIEYQHDGVTLEGFFAWDDGGPGARPGVMVSHAWGGRSELECEKARQLVVPQKNVFSPHPKQMAIAQYPSQFPRARDFS
jgi:hypothetical protein